MKFNVSVLLGNKITGYIVEAATHREAEKIAVEVSDRKNKTLMRDEPGIPNGRDAPGIACKIFRRRKVVNE